MKVTKHSPLWRGLIFVSAALLTVAIGLSVILEVNRNDIDGYLNTHSTVTVSTDDGTLFTAYTPDAEYLEADGTANSTALIEAHVSLNRRMSAEGSVLLKNNGVLPLNSETNNNQKPKVTLLGIRSYVIRAGSEMGVTVPTDQVIQLETALAENYDINPVMSAVYESVNATDAYQLTNIDSFGSGMGMTAEHYDPKEVPIEALREADADYADSFAQYGDAAIVVVSRPSSEGTDFIAGEAGIVENSGADTVLQLTDNEKDVIRLATDNFDKVIVLVNTNSAMEIDELKRDENIDAILWVGHPGCYGTYGIADILCGKVNPSGHLYDIYAADSLSSPAMMNMGIFSYSNAADLERVGTNNGGATNYIIEAEGIYTGYRYYETRYEDVVLGRGNASSAVGAYRDTTEWNYTKEVTYGFGYGLSYTTFEQSIESVDVEIGPHSIDAEVTVTVTNTGNVAGMDVVQVYGQAPYIEGGIEKPSVQLMNFIKTESLAPGETKEYTVTVDLQNIASWDSSAANGNGSYILDSGDYYFSIGNGAHEALNNILARKGKTMADGMDAEGDADKSYLWNYRYANGGVDESTFNVTKAGTQVFNSLETADWNYYESGKVTYLSRSAWDSTYPKTYEDMTATAEMADIIKNNNYEIQNNPEEAEKVLFNQSGDLKFADMKGAEYDDPRWEQLLNQLDLKEAVNFILSGNRTLPAMESVGFLAGRYTENGPNGIGGRGFQTISYDNFGDNKPDWYIPENDENGSFRLNIFPSAPVVASTFNPEIAYEQGKLIGNDALFVGLPILWGPGMNTHRHPYNGRNGEYYSEDPILTSVMGMEFSIAAYEKGLIAAPKHYAFNDQDQNRYGVAPYMTEQRAREIELRAFQIAFEATKYDKLYGRDVGMMGVMTSFSKIGPYEVNACEGLINGILRGEWGFNGYVVTDASDDGDRFVDCIMAGVGSFDASWAIDDNNVARTGMTSAYVESFKTDPDLLNAIKTAVHYDLYVISNSNYMNTVNTTTHTEWRMTWWRSVYISALAVTSCLTVGFCVMYTLSQIKGKKEE